MKKTLITLASATAITSLTQNVAFATEESNNQSGVSSNTQAPIELRNDNLYHIQQGDTLYKISKAFGITIDQLKEWNHLESDLIIAGEHLIIAQTNDNSNNHVAEPTSTVVNAPQEATPTNAIIEAYDTLTNNQAYTTTTAPINTVVETSDTLSNQDDNYTTTTTTSYSRPSFHGGANLYTAGQCTYYAFEKRPDISNTWGNANNWANAAIQSGYTVNNKPSVGAIMQTTAGAYGHVAYVENVNPDGSIQVSEMNYQGEGIVSARTISASAVHAYNYIH